jgi:hypothetical protein
MTRRELMSLPLPELLTRLEQLAALGDNLTQQQLWERIHIENAIREATR